jgi:hypothetical protein
VVRARGCEADGRTRCQIWPSFCPPLVSSACRLRESQPLLTCVGAPKQVRSGSCCSWRSTIAPNAGSSCAELWSLICSRRLRSFLVNYFIERNAQRRQKSRCRFFVCRRGHHKPSFQRGHSEGFVSPSRKGIVTKRYKSGSFALSLVACPDFRFLLCAKTRQSNQGRGMALRVFNYSQVVLMSP